MKYLVLTGIMVLVACAASAGILTLEDFAGVSPFTFEGYDLPWANQDVDFGDFSISGEWDTYAYYMPFAPPVEAPAIGADTATITFDPPVPRVGFDMGTQWSGIAVQFLGAGETVIASMYIEDFVPEGTGPFGYGHQGFVGYEDDGGMAIHQVILGSGDWYMDNLMFDTDTVSSEETSLDHIKALYR